MCNYQGYEFGAGSYPDSICIDGKLYDADNCDSDGMLYEPFEHIPCPMCRPTECVEYWYDRNCDAADDAEAKRCALALVNDIRANRGADPVTA